MVEGSNPPWRTRRLEKTLSSSYRRGLFSFAWWGMVAQGSSISMLYQAFCEMVEKRREGSLSWLPNSLPNFA